MCVGNLFGGAPKAPAPPPRMRPAPTIKSAAPPPEMISPEKSKRKKEKRNFLHVRRKLLK